MMKRKSVLLIALMFVFALLLAACGAGSGMEPAAGDAPETTEEPRATPTPGESAVDSYEALLEALRADGLQAEAAGAVEDPFFDVETQLLTVDGAMIQVYQFAGAAAAEEAAGTVNASGTIIGTSTVDWIEPPHFYRQGRLLALYAGTDETILSALAEALGEPFVVGQTMGLPPADGPANDVVTPTSEAEAGAAAMDTASLLEALGAAGATVQPLETLTQPFFETDAQIIEVDGAQIQVFEFADEAAAQAAADTVGADGTSVGTSIMHWMDAPHFYQQGRLIVLYVGSDAEVLSLLQTVMGPQFAGFE